MTLCILALPAIRAHASHAAVFRELVLPPTQKSLRKLIGVVPQDTVLFNNDIRYKMLRNKVMPVVVGICQEMNVPLPTYTPHR